MSSSLEEEFHQAMVELYKVAELQTQGVPRYGDYARRACSSQAANKFTGSIGGIHSLI